ncbi:MAG: hypothetical protein IKM00_09590 [Clostridia bacterium]|nr:hypothetical protein [Clostridia bacterium]MBR6745450.1 hypothetical protein [Clostridia bacterium]
MKEKNYVFRFHDPNTEEITALFFLKTAVEANMERIEEMILHTAAAKGLERPAENDASSYSA